MSFNPENPLIVQGDHTVLLEVHSPRAETARDAIAPFAELIKSPEHVHTYRLTPLSIWNARAAGMDVSEMTGVLGEYAKYPVPDAVFQEIRTLGARYGLAVIERDGDFLVLRVSERPLAELLAHDDHVAPLLGKRISDLVFRVALGLRGQLKQALVGIGYPAEDLAGYVSGDKLAIELRKVTRAGEPFVVRDYQRRGADIFTSVRTGTGRAWCHHPAVRFRQDHRWYVGHGGNPGEHPGADHQPDFGQTFPFSRPAMGPDHL